MGWWHEWHGLGFLVLGTNAAIAPRVGEARFGVTVTNAPRRSNGTLLLGLAPDVAGTDVAPLGLVLHVNLALPVIGESVVSDSGGVGLLRLPIPASGSFAGARLWPQSVWLEPAASGRACSGAFLRLVASRGLSICILP